MKRLSLYVCMLALLFMVAGDLFAGSVDYRSNQSAEYIRTGNRNATTDGADAVIYNPAGVVKREDGMYVNVGNQYIMKEYTAEDTFIGTSVSVPINPEQYKTTTPSPVVPNLFAIMKQDNWAAFLGLTVTGGGGDLEFDGGTPMIRSGLFSAISTALTPTLGATAAGAAGLAAANNIDTLKLSSMYIGGTIGGAYEINDMFSVSLGVRYLYGRKTIVADAKSPDLVYTTTDGNIADVKLEATGYGGIIGLNVVPIKDVNIGIRYETNTTLEWDTTVAGSYLGTAIVQGLGHVDEELRSVMGAHKEKKDLPARAALGISYNINPELLASVSYTYYFIKQAKWQHYNNEYYGDANDDYDNGWEAGISFEYNAMPELLVSVGYLYTVAGSNEETLSDVDISLNSNMFCAGLKYEVTPELDVNLGLMWTLYKDASRDTLSSTGTPIQIDYTKGSKVIAIGVEYKAM